MLPSSWNRYKVPRSTTVLQWIADFSERIKQLKGISQVANDSPNSTAPLKGVHVWLGGLFTAEAYITATRQYVAQANQWSLEELTLSVGNSCFIGYFRVNAMSDVEVLLCIENLIIQRNGVAAN